MSEIAIAPRPVQRPGPPLWLGAAADAAIRRAARLGAGLLAQDAAAIGTYLDARRSLAVEEPARIALELEAGALLSGAGRCALAALVEAAGGAETFDLVARAEAEGGSGWLSPRELDALVEAVAALAQGL